MIETAMEIPTGSGHPVRTSKHVLTALVENRPGVLSRVANLFRRRNFNIDSLTVGRTHRDDLSRMTLVMDGSQEEVERLEKNLYKLINVIHVEHMTDRPSLYRDLALIKVAVSGETRREVHQLAEIFRARIVDVSPESMIIELTGEESKIENFTDLLRPFGIVEMVRTGVVAMGRGEHTLEHDSYQPRAGVLGSRKSVL
ncbi:MAG TPA: acetolactate synthase small subunit [Thermoanaerobaculia bacterium]|nr:acetolactate synthase small subunit [Thermoanaerobaculia bacterium]